jgi:hypothetical protein
MRIVFVFLLLLSSLFSDDDYHREHYYKKDLTFLQLTSTQSNAIKDILKRYRTQTKKYKEFEHALLKRKQDIFLSEVYDPKKIEHINIHLAIMASKIENDFLLDIKNILNDDQRKKFANYIDEWELE